MRDFLRRLLSSRRARPDSHLVGDAGEDLACKLLRKKGYRILGRNLELRFTEVDVLAEAVDRNTIVLVEVKTRTRREDAQDESFVAEFAVDENKRKLLIRAARQLAHSNRWYNRTLRIDVIAVEYSKDAEKCIVRHREDVVK